MPASSAVPKEWSEKDRPYGITGLVWRGHKRYGQCVSGLPGPSARALEPVSFQPDLDMERLAEFAGRPPQREDEAAKYRDAWGKCYESSLLAVRVLREGERNERDKGECIQDAIAFLQGAEADRDGRPVR